MPDVSVIVPNFNHAKFLTRRLDSIIDQTYQDFELILLDDCSTDNSVEILSDYSRNSKVSHFIVNEQNSGSTYKQWIKGIGLARGEYVWIAESDDYSDRKFLEVMIKHLSSDQNIGIAYCQSVEVDENDKHLRNRMYFTSIFNEKRWESDFLLNGQEFVCKYMLTHNIISNASCVVTKKDLLAKAIPSKITLKLNTDWLIWVKILQNSSISFSSQPLNYFRIHNESTTNKLHKTSRPHYELLLIVRFIKKNFINKEDARNLTPNLTSEVNIIGMWWIETMDQRRLSIYDAHFLFQIFKIIPDRFVCYFSQFLSGSFKKFRKKL